MAEDSRNVIEEAKRRCRRVIDRIEALPAASITASCKLTLLRLVRAELSFLSRLPPSSSSPLSANIGHLEAVVHFLQQPFVTGVSRVCKPIPQPSLKDKSCRSSSSARRIHVDIVCTINGNPAWIIVSDRNPEYVFWDGGGKNKGLRLRIQEVLKAARSSDSVRPSSIVFFFSSGINENVLEKVNQEFGASKFGMEIEEFEFSEEMDGEWMNVLMRYQESTALEIEVYRVDNAHSTINSGFGDSGLGEVAISEKDVNFKITKSFSALISGMKALVKDMDSAKPYENLTVGDLINFDTTALIALVSEISNGGAEKLLAKSDNELRQRFKGNVEFVIGQVKSELEKPIHEELKAIISSKRGVICEAVLSEFKELMSMCGGTKEKLRADELLKSLIVVPDHPSDRMMALPTTRKLAQKNKIVFGTGDHWHAPTLTANMAFVRAISQTGMPLYTIAHRPRALTGD